MYSIIVHYFYLRLLHTIALVRTGTEKEIRMIRTVRTFVACHQLVIMVHLSALAAKLPLSYLTDEAQTTLRRRRQQATWRLHSV